jgi:hypothetical protein
MPEPIGAENPCTSGNDFSVFELIVGVKSLGLVPCPVDPAHKHMKTNVLFQTRQYRRSADISVSCPKKGASQVAISLQVAHSNYAHCGA